MKSHGNALKRNLNDTSASVSVNSETELFPEKIRIRNFPEDKARGALLGQLSDLYLICKMHVIVSISTTISFALWSSESMLEHQILPTKKSEDRKDM